MPFYLAATTPPPQPHNFDYAKKPTLQLVPEPATSFCWHSIKNYGPFETIEAAEATIIQLMPNGWRHLYPEDSKFINLPDAIRTYTDVPVVQADALYISLIFAFRLSDVRKSKAGAVEVGREAQGIYEDCWNDGFDLGMGLPTYILELAHSVAPTGMSLQFLDDGARNAAMAAVEDRQMRAAMIHASVTRFPRRKWGDRSQLLWDLRDLLNAAGLIMIYLNDDPGDMLVIRRPEGM